MSSTAASRPYADVEPERTVDLELLFAEKLVTRRSHAES